MNYKEFNSFTVDELKRMINHDIGNAIDLFADSYVAIYRIAARHKRTSKHNA